MCIAVMCVVRSGVAAQPALHIGRIDVPTKAVMTTATRSVSAAPVADAWGIKLQRS